MGRQVCVKQMHSSSNISNPRIVRLLSAVSTRQFEKPTTLIISLVIAALFIGASQVCDKETHNYGDLSFYLTFDLKRDVKICSPSWGKKGVAVMLPF